VNWEHNESSSNAFQILTILSNLHVSTNAALIRAAVLSACDRHVHTLSLKQTHSMGYIMASRGKNNNASFNYISATPMTTPNGCVYNFKISVSL